MSTKETLAESLNTADAPRKPSQVAAMMGKASGKEEGAEPSAAPMSDAERIAALEAALKEKDAKIAELEESAEPKTARVSFAIRPSRYKAFVELAEHAERAQGPELEFLIEHEYKLIFAGKNLPTATEAAEWMSARGKGKK